MTSEEKVKLNDPKNNEKEPEILPHFDKLHIYCHKTRRKTLTITFQQHVSYCRQFPDVQGLCTPVLGQNLSFLPVNSTFF